MALVKAFPCQPHLIPTLSFVYQTPVYWQIGIKQFSCLIVTRFRKHQIPLSIECFGLERFLTISENQIHLLGINACRNWDNSRINFFSFLSRQPNIIKVMRVGIKILVALGKWLYLFEPLGPHLEESNLTGWGYPLSEIVSRLHDGYSWSVSPFLFPLV